MSRTIRERLNRPDPSKLSSYYISCGMPSQRVPFHPEIEGKPHSRMRTFGHLCAVHLPETILVLLSRNFCYIHAISHRNRARGHLRNCIAHARRLTGMSFFPHKSPDRAIDMLQKLMLLFCVPVLYAATIAQNLSLVPGTVIAHSPASSGVYLGSPSITLLPDGTYLATHDRFGTVGERGFETYVYRSADKGAHWEQISVLSGQRWSSLHVLKNAVYLIGVHGPHGNAVIRKSTDRGIRWTEPSDAASGLLIPGDSLSRYHCAPVPMLLHNGRVWRAMERYEPNLPWGSFRSFVMSAPADADLLNRTVWTFSNELPHPRTGLPGSTWLEGNILLTPEKRLVNILRCHTETDNIACVLAVSDDGTTVTPDPEMPTIALPGACKKFTVRYDERSGRYWSLTNYPLPRYRGLNHVERTRNTAVLVSSSDLRSWQIHDVILESKDVKRTGFQYIDWFFEGDDLVAISRTAFDDGMGGAHDCHDSNLITVHRVAGFRSFLKDKEAGGNLPEPFPGSTLPQSDILERAGIIGIHSDFHGYDCCEFLFEGRTARIVRPHIPADGRPWIWRSRFWEHEPQTEVALLKNGFHVAFCDVAELYGNPEAIGIWDRFYRMLVGAGLCTKVTLEGLSRGGIYMYRWASVYPERVACVYADAPVLDVRSWPGGKGKSNGNPVEWERLKQNFGLRTEEEALAFTGSPIDLADQLAQGGFPMIHVCGDADLVVPPEENTDPFERRVLAAGGRITVIRKPGVGHHPHSLADPGPIVDFILEATRPACR